MAAKTLKINVNPPLIMIVILFAITILLPSVISISAINYLSEKYIDFEKETKLAEGIKSIKLFNYHLKPENYLESKIAKLSTQIPQQYYDSQPTPEELREAIETLTGVETTICVFFDKKLTNVQRYFRNHEGINTNIIPATAMFRRIIRHKQAESKVQSFSSRQLQQNRNISNFIQTIFHTITPVNIKHNKVVHNLSLTWGGDLYFLFFDFKNSTGGFDGALIIIKGSEICKDLIINEATRKNPKCKIINKSYDFSKTQSFNKDLKTEFVFADNRVQITAATNEHFSRHALQNGTIKIQDTDKLLFPFISYTSEPFLSDFLFIKIVPYFKNILFLITLAFIILLLRIHLFGFTPSKSFKRRVITTLVLASIFPFMLFSIVFYLHHDYSVFIEKINLEKHLSLRLEQINNELYEHMQTISERIRQLSSKHLLGLSSYCESYIKQRLKELSEKTMSAFICFSTPEIEQISMYFEKNSILISPIAPNLIQRLVQERVIELHTDLSPHSDRTAKYHFDIQVVFEDRFSELNDIMMLEGELYAGDTLGTPIFFTSINLNKEKNGKTVPYGTVSYRLEADIILKDFFENISLKDSDFAEYYNERKIHFAFLPLESAGTFQLFEGAGNIYEAIKHQSRYPNINDSFTINVDDGFQKAIAIRTNTNIPHIAVAITEPYEISSLSIASIAAVFLYQIFLFAFINSFLNRILVVPVSLMAKNASLIARNHENWDVKIHTGDELEDMNKNMVSMIEGLKSRNLLKDYVSSQAFDEIKNAQSLKLTPGGEHIFVSALFISLSSYKDLIETTKPSEVIKVINNFIEICDQCAKKNNGYIDKIVEGTIMIVFRENENSSLNHAYCAVKSALEIKSTIDKNQENSIVSAGIASGKVISGRIGSYKGKLDYTIIGDTVNLAARLKSEAEQKGSGIIISGSSMKLLKGKARVKFLRRCALKGKSRMYNIYELINLRT